MIQEKAYSAMPGGPMLAALLLALAADVGLFVLGFWVGLWLIIAAAVLLPFILALFAGLFAVPPNEARVLQLFGRTSVPHGLPAFATPTPSTPSSASPFASATSRRSAPK